MSKGDIDADQKWQIPTERLSCFVKGCAGQDCKIYERESKFR